MEKTYSTKPHSVYLRQRYSTDDAFVERKNKRDRRHYGKTRMAKIRADAQRNEFLDRKKIDVVKRHLAKNRSVSDIAVREFWLVSYVQKIIDIINKENTI